MGQHPRLSLLYRMKHTLFNVLLQVDQASIEELLLSLGDLANWQDVFNTVGSKLNLGGEEVDTLVLVQRAVNESWLNDALDTLSSLEQALSEASTSHSHRESGRASTILGLDDLVTTKLYTVDELLKSGSGDIGVVGLREKRNDGYAGVSTNNGDVLISWVGLLDLRNEAGSANHIESGDTEKTLGVVDTL